MGAAALAILVTSSGVVIDQPADFRQLSELAGACWLVLLAARHPRTAVLRWCLVALVVPVTVATVVVRTLVI